MCWLFPAGTYSIILFGCACTGKSREAVAMISTAVVPSDKQNILIVIFNIFIDNFCLI